MSKAGSLQLHLHMGLIKFESCHAKCRLMFPLKVTHPPSIQVGTGDVESGVSTCVPTLQLKRIFSFFAIAFPHALRRGVSNSFIVYIYIIFFNRRYFQGGV